RCRGGRIPRADVPVHGPDVGPGGRDAPGLGGADRRRALGHRRRRARRDGQEVLRPHEGSAPDPGDGSGDPTDPEPEKGDPMSNNPDEIRADIERTRHELSADVDALAEKANPTKAVHRQGDRVREGLTNMKESIMGSPTDPYSST